MSRHKLTPRPELADQHQGVEVSAGWDKILDGSGAWFLQVAIPDEVGFPREWIFGSTPDEACFSDLNEMLAKVGEYALIDDDLRRALTADAV
jgi:hypothetical protein